MTDQGKKCVPKRQFPRENALSCQRERGQKMDAAVQELGSGAQPDDCPLWRQAYPVSVKRKNRDTTSDQKMSRSYSIGISSIARNSQPYSGGRVWAAPT